MGFRVLDHTADTGIDVEADDLAGLFADGARGFGSCITDLESLDERLERRFSIASDDLGDLMVDWLSELLYVFEVEAEIFKSIDVKIVKKEGAFRLDAICRGERFDADRHPLKVPIKAVTYHQLKVEKDQAGRWQARVIFDI